MKKKIQKIETHELELILGGCKSYAARQMDGFLAKYAQPANYEVSSFISRYSAPVVTGSVREREVVRETFSPGIAVSPYTYRGGVSGGEY